MQRFERGERAYYAVVLKQNCLQFSLIFFSSLRLHPHLWVFKSLILPKTLQNIFPYPSVFVSFSPVYTKTLENDENDWELGCACADEKIWTEMMSGDAIPRATNFHVAKKEK